MARIRVTPVDSDSGYPESRTVDGTNVEKVASNEGAFKQFGKIRHHHTSTPDRDTPDRDDD